MNKWLSVELSLLLLVSLVAGVGLFSLSGSDSSVDFESVNDLSGFQTASPSTTSTVLYNGLGERIIKFGSEKSLEGLKGQTCFYHAKTGSYYKFKVTGYGPGNANTGGVAFTKETSQFGGKGGKCQQINLDLKGTTTVSEIRISGVRVAGSPNAYNTKFDVVFAKPAPTSLSCAVERQPLSPGQSCCAGLVVKQDYCTGALPGKVSCASVCSKPAPGPLLNGTNYTQLPVNTSKIINQSTLLSCAALGGKCGRVGLMGVIVLSGASDCPNSCYGGSFGVLTPTPNLLPNRTNYTQPIVNTSKIINQSTNCRWVCS